MKGLSLLDRHRKGRRIAMLRVALSLLPAALALSGCDYGVEWKEGKYEVHWIDSDHRSLVRTIDDSHTIGRVGPEVIAVGSDDQYVVAKQRAKDGHSVFYFVVDKKRDSDNLNADQIVQGPLSDPEFVSLKAQKELPDFSIAFEGR